VILVVLNEILVGSDYGNKGVNFRDKIGHVNITFKWPMTGGAVKKWVLKVYK